MKRIRSIQYWGGKSGGRNAKVGRFVARVLPVRSAYCEPFAGMLGVLLRRRPVICEIVNDLDKGVVNWWRVVRNQPDELMHRVWNLPNSEVEFHAAVKLLKKGITLSEDGDDGDLDAAVAFFMVCQHSILHTAAGSMLRTNAYAIHFHKQISRWPPDVVALNHRMRNVQVVCRDGCDLLEQTAKWEDMAIFIDPPYGDTTNSPYAADVDHDRLFDLIRAQRGAVAVSGYGEEWDSLGDNWFRQDFQSDFVAASGTVTPRDHRVWMNFDPNLPTLFGGAT